MTRETRFFRFSSLPTYRIPPRGSRSVQGVLDPASASGSRKSGSTPRGVTAIFSAGTSRRRRASDAVYSEMQMTPSARRTWSRTSSA